MHRPRLLIRDEPTLGLDRQARRHLWERIRELQRQGMTAFVTTHYLDGAEASDRVGIIDRGKLVALGKPGVELVQRQRGVEQRCEARLSVRVRQVLDQAPQRMVPRVCVRRQLDSLHRLLAGILEHLEHLLRPANN